ncbi:MAG: DUF3037 domain-containing protein [Candidatus Omnitrophica bacterium]|nr:DUF3037 domain-containing protein [Candidatus Omnitrophota bacterium]
MEKSQYEFACIRYIPNIVTGEFLNVGVVLFCPSSNLLIGQFVKKTSRVSRLFPGFNSGLYREMIKYLDETIKAESGNIRDQILIPVESGLTSIMNRILIPDDSSYQLGPIGIGLTSSPQRELPRLFDRMVGSRSAEKTSGSKTEEKVWETFQKVIIESKQSDSFVRYIPKTPLVKPFDHTIKNGRIHVFEPVNFRMKSESKITEKAFNWVGTGDVIQKKDSEIGKLYFLVSDPPENGMRSAYDKALEILDVTSIDHEIIPESQADMLPRIVDKITDH